MAHREKYLLRAVDTTTGEVVRQKWVYDSYVALCFACDWYLEFKQQPTMPAIYIDEQIHFYGWPRMVEDAIVRPEREAIATGPVVDRR